MNKRRFFTFFVIAIITAAGVKILFERNLNGEEKAKEDKVAVEYYEDSSGEIEKNFSLIKYRNIEIKIPDENFIFVRGVSFKDADVEFRHYWPNINLGLRETLGRFLIRSRLTVGPNIPSDATPYQNFLNRESNKNVQYEISDRNEYQNLIKYEEKTNNLSWVYIYDGKDARSKTGGPIFITCLKETYLHAKEKPGNGCEIVDKYNPYVLLAMDFEENHLDSFPDFYLEIIKYFDGILERKE